MYERNDIYAIKARIGNIMAREDIALSPVGDILVNYYALFLKELHDFSETVRLHAYDTDNPAHEISNELKALLLLHENLPMQVIKAAGQAKWEPLYDQVLRLKAQFDTNEEALAHFAKEYKDLTNFYGLKGDEFWLEAESASSLTPDHNRIMTLARQIRMCKYLIQKENSCE